MCCSGDNVYMREYYDLQENENCQVPSNTCCDKFKNHRENANLALDDFFHLSHCYTENTF